MLRLVLGQVLRLASSGPLSALAGTYAVARLLASIAPSLPGAEAATARRGDRVLIGFALLACWLPARSVRVDPNIALRPTEGCHVLVRSVSLSAACARRRSSPSRRSRRLALCLGSTVTIFALVDAVLLRPLPYPEADRLVTIAHVYDKLSLPTNGASLTSYFERRGRIPALASMAALDQGASLVGDTGATSRESIGRLTCARRTSIATRSGDVGCTRSRPRSWQISL